MNNIVIKCYDLKNVITMEFHIPYVENVKVQKNILYSDGLMRLNYDIHGRMILKVSRDLSYELKNNEIIIYQKSPRTILLVNREMHEKIQVVYLNSESYIVLRIIPYYNMILQSENMDIQLIV